MGSVLTLYASNLHALSRKAQHDVDCVAVGWQDELPRILEHKEASFGQLRDGDCDILKVQELFTVQYDVIAKAPSKDVR